MLVCTQEYKMYYAQSLYKAGLYEPALRACQNVADNPELGQRVLSLQVRQTHPFTMEQRS